MLRALRLVASLLVFGFAFGGCAIFKNKPSPPEAIDFGIIEDRLAPLRSQIRQDIRVAVGAFEDKTGQYKDSNILRYSSAVTKGGPDVLSHLLYRALGPRVLVERDPRNLAQIRQEYEMTYKYDNEGRQVGLIQKGGPSGGLSGAEYLITGAVIYYSVDRYSGGGGVNFQGIGVNARFGSALVAVELRLVDMGSSEVLWSTVQQSGVEGWQVGADIFRFVSSSGRDYLVQAEVGMAAQLPADYALQTSLEESVVQMVLENEDIFLKPGAGRTSPPGK
jgi:curli biogenesis system outer membrane secretion channel CsgG